MARMDIEVEKFFVVHSISNHQFPSDTWCQVMHYKFDEDQRNCMVVVLIS